MTWPQYVLAGWLLLGTISGWRAAYTNRELSSVGVLLAWSWTAAFAVLIAVALSCGGFW